PRGQPALLLLPAFRPAPTRARQWHRVNIAVESLFLERRDKSFAAMLRPELSLVFAESQASKTALQQMLGAEPADRVVVGMHQRHALVAQHADDIDDRQAAARDDIA